MKRLLVILAAYAAFCIVYLGAPRLAWHAPLSLSPSAVDRVIPFMPWTIAVYLSQFGILFLALWRARDVRPALTAAAVATMVAAMIFIVAPTAIARPQTDNAAFAALWTFDVATNCFPSLHVALAMIAAAFWPYRRWRPAAASWAIAIAASTLTTKQHYALDILGGAVLGVIAIRASQWHHTSASPALGSAAR
jgi:membrane-associated phospholipid phosphatase